MSYQGSILRCFGALLGLSKGGDSGKDSDDVDQDDNGDDKDTDAYDMRKFT